MLRVNYIITSKNIESLLPLIAQGNESAFSAFFDHFYPELLNYAVSLLKSRHAGEEILSCVFENIWRNKEKITEVKKINTYLFVSVKNRCYNYLRDNKQVSIDHLEGKEFSLKMTLENPESTYISKELKLAVLQSIEGLPPKCQMIFRLVKEDSLKYKEVASLLDLSVKTVEEQMGRAVAKLRKSLKPIAKDFTGITSY